AGIANQLDDKLWQDGQDSIIPHHCSINAREYNQYNNIPILITDNLFITSVYDVLINIMDVALDPQRVKVKELKEFVYQ
ncbi:DNA polymerase III subunit chi, partial [Francisella tularensis]|uniref:DNA polymerase III subunit chi n=1 Tax=Francisella tularensis TaxID=263 RepID=UPI002381CEF8